MLSRVAESIFWMSRHIERAENIGRLIDVNIRLTLDVPMDIKLQWEPIINITGDKDLFFSKNDVADQDNVIDFLVFNRSYANSIITCVNNARENARSVRAVIPIEMWQCINEFYLFLVAPIATGEAISSPNSFFSKVKNYSQLFVGIAETIMPHDEGWHFLRIGRLLERSDKTSRILDVKYFIVLPRVDYVGSAYDNIHWAALLRSASALDMYRKHFHGTTPANILAFLFFDPDFPRSIKHCLRVCDASLHEISGTPMSGYANDAERRLGILRSEIEYSDVSDIMQCGLHEYIDSFQEKLNNVGNAISDTFFTAQPPTSMSIRKIYR